MLQGWGRAHHFNHDIKTPSYCGDVIMDQDGQKPLTFYGKGRSYGDVALNDGGTIMVTQNLDRLQFADWDAGIIRAEAGVSLSDLLSVIIPKGWFLPVTPGTKYVTLGGAVANDVHGKNHHEVGSFGSHVLRLGLRRSNGETLCLSPDQNSELFALTISGLGLTGFIEWVELKLLSIKSTQLTVENHPYNSLQEFFELSRSSVDWMYCVAWLDCFSENAALGRGIFTRANHCRHATELKIHAEPPRLKFPVNAPNWILNKTTIRAFNHLYRHRSGARFCGEQFYNPFFYPLDGIQGWNRLYGGRGFYQYQCIIPAQNAYEGIKSLLEAITRSNKGSFLAVLKSHGQERSPGRNSFCLEGTSLALDFANQGAETRALLKALEMITLTYGGRIYPAKDGLMSADAFQQGYKHWQDLENARDPALNSSFWQRVTGL